MDRANTNYLRIKQRAVGAFPSTGRKGDSQRARTPWRWPIERHNSMQRQEGRLLAPLVPFYAAVASYELTRCMVCGGGAAVGVAGPDDIRAEGGVRSQLHMRRPAPRT